jgi:hypothetical protein
MPYFDAVNVGKQAAETWKRASDGSESENGTGGNYVQEKKVLTDMDLSVVAARAHSPQPADLGCRKAACSR